MRSASACLLFLAMAIGCSSGESHPLVSVSGVVTLDDKPLANASVNFQPIGKAADVGPSSFGITDDQGKYTLKTVMSDESGAVAGKHKVNITLPIDDESNDAGGYENAEGQLPVRYNRNTELTLDVPDGGTDKADFDLKSD